MKQLNETSSGLRNLHDYFPHFTGCWCIESYWPRSHSGVSRSLVHYKKGDSASVRHWNRKAVELLKNTQINISCIIRALGSNELACNRYKGTDHLGLSLSVLFDCEYNRDLLSKKRTTKPMHKLSRWRRQKELEGVYQLKRPLQDGCRGILIIDDIVTTGATMNAILGAIRKYHSSLPVYFFAFARTIDTNITIDINSYSDQHE